jgi:hypothetical protein
MEPNCILHENRLKAIEDNVHIIGVQLTQLLDRDNDFTVKVINGTTKERLASELIGEMYQNMKELNNHTLKNSFYNLSKIASATIPILFVIALVLMFLGYSHLANQIANLTK